MTMNRGLKNQFQKIYIFFVLYRVNTRGSKKISDSTKKWFSLILIFHSCVSHGVQNINFSGRFHSHTQNFSLFFVKAINLSWFRFSRHSYAFFFCVNDNTKLNLHFLLIFFTVVVFHETNAEFVTFFISLNLDIHRDILTSVHENDIDIQKAHNNRTEMMTLVKNWKSAFIIHGEFFLSIVV